MTQISFIILAMCLSAATVDMALDVCLTCGDNPTSHICGLFSNYVACMDEIEDGVPNCKYDESYPADRTSIKSAMAVLGCSGVSGLASSLSLIVAFSVLAYLLNNKH